MAEKIVFELKIDHMMECCVLDLGPMAGTGAQLNDGSRKVSYEAN